jgi:hypothetical protein
MNDAMHRGVALYQQFIPLVERLAAATRDLPNKVAWQVIAAEVEAVRPSIPRELRGRINLKRDAWAVRGRLRDEVQRHEVS